MRNKDFYTNELIYQLQTKNRLFRTSIFICGVLIYAISFNLFFFPNDIVSSGTTGLSIIVHELTGMESSLFVLIFSLSLLVVSYLFLGRHNTVKALLGSILLPVFLEFSEIYQQLLGLENISLFLQIFIGGALMGLGNGLVLKSGFSTGGFQIIYQILYNKLGISIGKSTLWLNGTLILIGGLFFGFSKSLYAIIATYISSVVTDKVMLETSATKTFYIITNKDKEISQYITQILGHGVTKMNARGGTDNDSKKILMCAVPTRQYFEMKNTIQEIDEEVFFLITDTYEIYGGI